MDSFTTFKKWANEIVLQSLALAYEKYLKLREQGDLAGSELIERDFFPKYEKLYFALEAPELEESYGESEDVKNQFVKILKDIMEKNGFSEEYITSKLEKRESLGVNSGELVIKRLYEYNLKELEKKKSKLLGEADDLLREEYEINQEISNAIQQEEQMELILKVHPVREKFRLIDRELQGIEEKIKEFSTKLGARWYYEIYGATSADELKEHLDIKF